MTTIKEVAQAAGVSIASVSRAFKEDAVINPQTRAHILKIADKLNYRPNLVARGLKRSRSQAIGIIIPSIDNYFYVDLLKQLDIALKRQQYRLMVSFIQHGGSDEKEALAAMAASQVEAIIFSPRNRDNAGLVQQLKANTSLLQLFTAPYPELDSLVMDDGSAVADAARYLMERGHQRILYVGGDGRFEGFVQAKQAAGCPAGPEWLCLGWPEAEEVARRIRSLQPTAILAVARQAEAAWHALKLLGLRIPEDISLIAYDDVNWVRMLDITAVAHQFGQIADMAVNQIMYRLRAREEADGASAPARMSLLPCLQERASVKDLREQG